METQWRLRFVQCLLVAALLMPVEAWLGSQHFLGWGPWDAGAHGSGFTQSGSESKPADYHQPLRYSPIYYTCHSLGSSPAGGSQQGYHSFGRYEVEVPGGPPPGYKPSYSVMPGLFDSHGHRGRIHLSSYRSTLFGHSKNFFRPSLPTVSFLPLAYYHYPSRIPPRTPWGCDCYVENRTAVCMYMSNRIPHCVDSSVTAIFIQSEEVDWLSSGAFRHLPHLEYINITATMLRSLPGELFSNNPDLRHLLVQKNPDLRCLDSMVFSSASNLEDVILAHNDIDSLERDLFKDLKNVKRLNLAYNKIRNLPEGIFRNNGELQELVLSGNPLLITSYFTWWDLLTNNAKLRVLLMCNCKLEFLPAGLLRNAANLEWLDLSHNKISSFPSVCIRDCAKLAYLGLAYNKLETLGSDVIQQYGGSLATLELQGNPWHCDCGILSLASWTALRKDASARLPGCSSPKYAEKQSLRHWFHSGGARNCNSSSTASLRTDLNRVLSVARAIAEKPPSFFANLLSISDDEVSFTATNYFLQAMAARTDAYVSNVVWLWARLLEKVLDWRHLRYAEVASRTGIHQIVLDRMKWAQHKMDKEELSFFSYDINMDPLTTTTTKPPAKTPLEVLPRRKGFEPLVNCTYIMNGVPEKLTEAVDGGIEEELKILFGVIISANADSLNTNTGLKNLEASEQTVTGLRSELREVLATLLLSIDRAKWDAAEQAFIEQEEKKPVLHPIVKVYGREVINNAGSFTLMRLQLTVLATFLTSLTHTMT